MDQIGSGLAALQPGREVNVSVSSVFNVSVSTVFINNLSCGQSAINQ